MATNIFLGYPPENIKQFIIDNYSKPVDMTKVPLHFTANEDGSSVSLACYGYDENNDYRGGLIDSWCEFEYSMTGKDDDWHPYIDPNSDDETLHQGRDINLNKGETVYIRATREKDDPLNQNKNRLCENEGEQYHFFKMKGSIKADGNIQFLLEKTGTIDYVPDYCYYHIFNDCTALTQAPILPTTKLYWWCYKGMFSGCTSLTQAPELPAMALDDYCYMDMFYGCTSLTQAPILPATTLAYSCYSSMFEGCSSLPEPKYKMPNLTFDEAANVIQSDFIFSDWYNGNPIQVQCSDKILIAAFDEDNWEWTIMEG